MEKEQKVECESCGEIVSKKDADFAESHGYFPVGVHGENCGCCKDSDDIGLHCECNFKEVSVNSSQD